MTLVTQISNNCLHASAYVIAPSTTTHQIGHHCPDCGLRWNTYPDSPATQATEALSDGPGTPKYRFSWLLSELEKRFPDPEPFSASLPEPRYLAMLDAALSSAKREAEPLGMGEASPEAVADASPTLRRHLKIERGSREHFWLLMAPYHLQMVTGRDAENLQSFARDVWTAALTQAPSPASAGEFVPEGYRLLKDTTPAERGYEGGNYYNTCHRCLRQFIGQKRQLTCKACLPPQPVEPKYRWSGAGPEPASWYAPDGTKVYRSYGDMVDD